MVGKHVVIAVCAGVMTLGQALSADAAAPGLAGSRQAVPVRSNSKPEIAAGTDGKDGWLLARYRDLVVRKTSRKKDRSAVIDLRLGSDVVVVGLSADGTVSVGRNGRSVAVTSPEAFDAVQRLLAGSAVVFGVRALLSEREAVSDLRAPEMSLLSAAAFVGSLVGDTDAPRRLSARFVEKHLGIVRPIRVENCWGDYAKETSGAWDELQGCMDDANQDDSFFRAAYRRLACNSVWMLRSESAWFEYLNCLSPLSLAK